ncbi:MAG: dihydropteroate synthase [Chthoniobacterales bacterium]
MKLGSVSLRARGREVNFPRRPLVMGILNLNDDSFSDDGTLDLDIALTRAQTMIAGGADIIDIGGESARTNRSAIAISEEIARVRPFVERFAAIEAAPRDSAQIFPPLLSINTWRPEVAREILAVGGDILNDMGALPTWENAEIAALHGTALVIMHSVGEPKVAHTHVGYDDVIAVQLAFFREKIAGALAAGLKSEQLILDPGIDFAKQRDDNLRLYREFQRIVELGFATLLPVSRKTVIGDVLGIPATERDAGTVACIVVGASRGASIFRVHNVEAAWQTLKMLEALN